MDFVPLSFDQTASFRVRLFWKPSQFEGPVAFAASVCKKLLCPSRHTFLVLHSLNILHVRAFAVADLRRRIGLDRFFHVTLSELSHTSLF